MTNQSVVIEYRSVVLGGGRKECKGAGGNFWGLTNMFLTVVIVLRVYSNVKTSNCALEVCSVYCMSIILQ